MAKVSVHRPVPGSIAWLEEQIANERYVSPDRLAELLEQHDEPLAEAVRKYVARSLRGEMKKPRGRPPAQELEKIADVLMTNDYRRYLAWLQSRKTTLGLKDCDTPNGAEWWQGPPAERAARLVARRYRDVRNISWRQVQNIASSAKR